MCRFLGRVPIASNLFNILSNFGFALWPKSVVGKQRLPQCSSASTRDRTGGLRSRESSNYSYLNATIGSTFVALRAGI